MTRTPTLVYFIAALDGTENTFGGKGGGEGREVGGFEQ